MPWIDCWHCFPLIPLSLTGIGLTAGQIFPQCLTDMFFIFHENSWPCLSLFDDTPQDVASLKPWTTCISIQAENITLMSWLLLKNHNVTRTEWRTVIVRGFIRSVVPAGWSSVSSAFSALLKDFTGFVFTLCIFSILARWCSSHFCSRLVLWGHQVLFGTACKESNLPFQLGQSKARHRGPRQKDPAWWLSAHFRVHQLLSSHTFFVLYLVWHPHLL